MSRPLVLSLFPGIGLLDMAFEEEGFCIVRGPDLLWGGDIRRFHPPAGRFDGVIGGPPCQLFSGLGNLARARGVVHENLIPEFSRVVAEAHPSWFLMENVPPAPSPEVEGYCTDRLTLNNRWFGAEQHRARLFVFGAWWPVTSKFRTGLDFAALESATWRAAVTASNGGRRAVHANRGTGGKIVTYTPDEAAIYQGLTADFLAESPFTNRGRLKVIAQGVPLPMGRAIARAVKRAIA